MGSTTPAAMPTPPPLPAPPGKALDHHPDALVIDCDHCTVAGAACGDCFVAVLLGPPHLAVEERAAVAVLADVGLVPPLRLVSAGPPAPGQGPADPADPVDPVDPVDSADPDQV
jgi:hypothetical protein